MGQWCYCGNASCKTIFIKEGHHKDVPAPHIRCEDCGKIIKLLKENKDGE